jgi:hypothetical protein
VKDYSRNSGIRPIFPVQGYIACIKIRPTEYIGKRWFMSVTITLSSELEEKISRRAAARGLPLEEYAREVLRRDVEQPTLRELFASVREQIETTGITDEALSTQIEGAVSEVRTRRRA